MPTFARGDSPPQTLENLTDSWFRVMHQGTTFRGLKRLLKFVFWNRTHSSPRRAKCVQYPYRLFWDLCVKWTFLRCRLYSVIMEEQVSWSLWSCHIYLAFSLARCRVDWLVAYTNSPVLPDYKVMDGSSKFCTDHHRIVVDQAEPYFRPLDPFRCEWCDAP